MPCKIGRLILPSHCLPQTIQPGAVSHLFLSFSAISYVLQLPLPFQRAPTLNTSIFASSMGTLLGNPILTTLNRLPQQDLLLLMIHGDKFYAQYLVGSFSLMYFIVLLCQLTDTN